MEFILEYKKAPTFFRVKGKVHAMHWDFHLTDSGHAAYLKQQSESVIYTIAFAVPFTSA